MKFYSTFTSDIKKKQFPITDSISAKSIRNRILALIKKDIPTFDKNKFLANQELDMYREKYISNY
jgi:hypothetical protein